jgi:cytochrome c oxidase subunit 2
MGDHRGPGGRLRIAVAVAAALLTTGCSRFSFPDPRSTQGDAILSLWRGAFIAAMVIGGFTAGLILWCVFRYRARGDVDVDVPRQVDYNVPLEIVYTAVPLLIVAVLFGFTLNTQRKVEKRHDSPMVVEVTGFQWQWRFRYPAQQVEVSGGPVNAARDNVPTMVLPVGKPVRVVLTSRDVIHAFWVPQFLFKKDNVPGRTNEFDLTVTKPGEYVGRCAEFCGLEHDRMTFRVRAVNESEFDAALASVAGVAQ